LNITRASHRRVIRIAGLIGVIALAALGGAQGCAKDPLPAVTPTEPATPAAESTASAIPGVITASVFEPGASGAPSATSDFSSLADALKYASSKAGFEIPVPTYLPPGYVVTGIDIPPKPPRAVSGEPPRVTLVIRTAKPDVMNLLIVNQRYTFPGDDPGHVIASPAPGSQIFKTEGPVGASGVQAFNFILRTPTRGAEITADNTLSDAEVVRILSSLPQN